MRMQTVATVGAHVSCVPAGKKKTLNGGGSATRFNTAGAIRASIAAGGQRRRVCARIRTKDRQERTRKGATTKSEGDWGLSGGGSATRFSTVGTPREKEPRGREGQRRWRGHTGARERERQKRTHKRNEHESAGGEGTWGGRGSNMNILTNATAIRRPPPLAVDGVIWPDKHSPYGLQCATRCRYGKQIYRKIGTRKCN